MPIKTGCIRNVLALPYTAFIRCPKVPNKDFCFLLCHSLSGKAARSASQEPIQREGTEAEIATRLGLGYQQLLAWTTYRLDSTDFF